MSDCPTKCLKESKKFCDKYQVQVYGDNTDSGCGSLDLTSHASYVAPSEGSNGVLYYCPDAKLSGPSQKCTHIQTRTIYNMCDSDWAQFEGINRGISWASDWDSTCQDFAQTLLTKGKAKSVACYNQETTDVGVETGEYAQVWPSGGFDVGASTFANKVACQTNPAYKVTECDTLGNLCDTDMFQDSLDNQNQIITKTGDVALETIEAIMEAIGEE